MRLAPDRRKSRPKKKDGGQINFSGRMAKKQESSPSLWGATRRTTNLAPDPGGENRQINFPKSGAKNKESQNSCFCHRWKWSAISILLSRVSISHEKKCVTLVGRGRKSPKNGQKFLRFDRWLVRNFPFLFPTICVKNTKDYFLVMAVRARK